MKAARGGQVTAKAETMEKDLPVIGNKVLACLVLASKSGEVGSGAREDTKASGVERGDKRGRDETQA